MCARCWASAHLPAAPVCERCGCLLDAVRDASPVRPGWCARCSSAAGLPWPIDRLQSAGSYAGALRDIVHAFKYGGHRSLAVPLAALIRETCGEALSGPDFAVPVPLHAARRWSRGFNQADDLARLLGLPVARALVRPRPTATQARLPSIARRVNVREAFRTRRIALVGPKLAGASVLLVDDVCTTGATLEACARALREAGVDEVRAVTAARAVRGRS